MRSILILEDDMNRVKQFKERLFEAFGDDKVLNHVSVAEDCIVAIMREEFDLIFLDHDLGGEVYVSSTHTNTGSEVARRFSELCLEENFPNRDTPIIVHSYNPDGAKYIMALLGKNAVYVPGVWDKALFHKTVVVD